jgi:hypothetical protein
LNDENKHYSILSYDDGINQKQIQIHAFTTLEKYYAFGDKENFYYREADIALNTIRNRATELNLINLESMDDLPESFKDYMVSTWQPVNDLIITKKKRTGIVIGWIYDESSNANFNKGSVTIPGSSVPLISGIPMPFMHPGWNNRESKLYPMGIYNWRWVYNKTWFFDKIGSYHWWGYNMFDYGVVKYKNVQGQTVYLFQSWNNKITSCVNVSTI